MHAHNAVSLSQADEARYQALLANSFTSDLTIVSTPDLRDWQEDGRLIFLLPGSSDTLIAEADLVDENDHVGFRWSGKLLNAPGYVNFDIREGLTGGYFLIGPNFYELIPADTNYQFLVQRAKGVEGLCDREFNPPSDLTFDPPDQCDYEPDYNDCPALITVLVIVTPEAEAQLVDSWGGLDLFIRFGEAMTNQAFYNSDIPNKEIRVQYVLRSGFEFDQDHDPDVDLGHFASWSASDREDYSADLVVLLAGEVYDDIGGVATLIGAPDIDRAFAIVEAEWYLSLGAFSHEIGHLFGCRHNWPANLGNDPEEICAHGFRHLDLVLPPLGDYIAYSWRTMMGVPVLLDELFIQYAENEEELFEWHESWILHYSNPEVLYHGDPTGKDAGWIADNAQQIRNTGCAVADFYPAQELAVFAAYSPDGCNETRTFTADVIPPESGLPGVAPYTITWYWNSTGVFNYPNQGTQSLGTGASITVTDPNCPRYYVKCAVLSADYVEVSRVLKVDLGSPDCCEETYPGGGGGHGRPGQGGDVTTENKPGRVYPNPLVGGTLYVEQGNKPARAFELFDQYGRTLSAGDIPIGKTPAGVIRLPELLPAGPYYLRLRTGNGTVETHKVFIIKS